MPALVVVVLDVFRNVRARLRECAVAFALHPFRLVTPKEPFSRCIVLAVAASTHAGPELVLPQLLLERPAGVMRPLIRVEQHLRRFAPRFIGHPQRLDRQGRVWMP